MNFQNCITKLIVPAGFIAASLLMTQSSFAEEEVTRLDTIEVIGDANASTNTAHQELSIAVSVNTTDPVNAAQILDAAKIDADNGAYRLSLIPPQKSPALQQQVNNAKDLNNYVRSEIDQLRRQWKMMDL